MNRRRVRTFDCVDMKRRIQEQIYEETRGMTRPQRLRHLRKRIAGSRFASFLRRPAKAPPETE
jgi:hypothetical protein